MERVEGDVVVDLAAQRPTPCRASAARSRERACRPRRGARAWLTTSFRYLSDEPMADDARGLERRVRALGDDLLPWSRAGCAGRPGRRGTRARPRWSRRRSGRGRRSRRRRASCPTASGRHSGFGRAQVHGSRRRCSSSRARSSRRASGRPCETSPLRNVFGSPVFSWTIRSFFGSVPSLCKRTSA